MAKMSKTDAEKIVSVLYYVILDRAPDKSGLTFWTNQMLNGASDYAVAYGLFNSDEYKRKSGIVVNSKKQEVLK